jgi:hypothetical protein
MGGFIQRCDVRPTPILCSPSLCEREPIADLHFVGAVQDCRKYAFGVVNMYGTDEDTPPFRLNGAWLFRGPEMIREMKAVDDSEYFEWTKVDVSKPAGKAIIEKMFTGENVGENSADKLLERRYFK